MHIKNINLIKIYIFKIFYIYKYINIYKYFFFMKFIMMENLYPLKDF